MIYIPLLLRVFALALMFLPAALPKIFIKHKWRVIEILLTESFL
jgi:hypothetical protein